MSIANLMNMTNIEMGLIVVEASIVLALLYLIHLGRIITRSMEKRHPFLNSHSLRKWMQEAEAICQDLSGNLEEKKEIAKRLIAQMDERIQRLHSMVKNIDEVEHSLSQGVNPVRNSRGALNPAGIIIKSNPAAEQRGIISNGVKEEDLEGHILKMAETGCDVSDIARELQLSKGEVQLTLDLEKYRQSLRI